MTNKSSRQQRQRQRQRRTQNPIQHETRQAERITIIEREARSSPVWMVLKIVTLPFRKLAGFIASLIGVIIRQMVRSIVAFVMGIVLFAGSVAMVVLYGVALVESNFDAIAALHLMAERISMFVQGLI